MSALDDLKHDIEHWVADLLEGYRPDERLHSFEVRDPILGFEVFDSLERAIIDSPVVQRLRDIRQTALAYHVYPSAHHTRFEHCLGVATCVGNMYDALAARRPGILTSLDRRELRLAGLLHDVGHGLFSHLSESVFSEHFAADLTAIRMLDPRFRPNKGLGEILSYLIVLSDPFRSMFDRLQDVHCTPAGRADLDRLAGYFLEYAERPEDTFKAQMISGSLDADKLDYFARDCHFTGIRAEIDVERILLVIDVDHRSEDPHRHLVIARNGVQQLEQSIFSKMLLHSSLYHHHTIRALEQAVRAIFEQIWMNPSEIRVEQLRFPSIASMLAITESDFWVLASSEPSLADRVKQLWKARRPPKRALAIGMATVDSESVEPLRKLWEAWELDPSHGANAARAIRGLLDASQSVGEFAIRVDLPRRPQVTSDAKKTRVDSGDSYVALEDYFPTGDWVASYSDRQMLGHVYVDDEISLRRSVTKAAKAYFESKYSITFKDLAVTQCYKDGEYEPD
jgi:HD superfamily phosphohydrolase